MINKKIKKVLFQAIKSNLFTLDTKNYYNAHAKIDDLNISIRRNYAEYDNEYPFIGIIVVNFYTNSYSYTNKIELYKSNFICIYM